MVVRFPAAGDPCLLAEVQNEFPTDIALREQDVVFSTNLRLGSLTR